MSLQSDFNAMFEYAAAQSEKRSKRKVPVVVESRLFSSMTDAAYWVAIHRPDLWENSKAAQDKDAYRVMRNLISRVRNWCNDFYNGNYHGQELEWFIAERGNPESWDNPPCDWDDGACLIEDLRK